jgi:hypothetical protein
MNLIPLFIENVYSSAGSVPPLSHLTSCAPTKSNLYFDISFATIYIVTYMGYVANK